MTLATKAWRDSLVVIVFLAATSSSVIAQTINRTPTATQLDTIFQPLVAGKSPGLAVVVLKNGKPVFERGYGLAYLETGAVNTPTTDFRLASCCWCMITS